MSAPTLTEFLLARIADDEAHVNGWCEDYVPCGQREHPGHRSEGRTRAECEAKRRIVREAHDYSPELSDGDNGEWALDMTLRHIATVYSDHPDYNQAWRP